jgi:hypothetical protein
MKKYINNLNYTCFIFIFPLTQSVWYVNRIQEFDNIRFLVQLAIVFCTLYYFEKERVTIKKTNEYKLILFTFALLALIINLPILFSSENILSRFFYIMVLTLLYYKRPNYKQVNKSFGIFVILSLILLIISIGINYFFPFVIFNDAMTPIRLSFIPDLVGFDTRFGGFYGYVNPAGYIALLLLIYSLRLSSITIKVTAILICLFSIITADSRGTYVAFFCVLFLSIFLSKNFSKNKLIINYIIFIIIMTILLYLLVAYTSSSYDIDILSGRNVITSLYLDSLSYSNIFFGIGDNGVSALLNNTELTSAASNAHNIFVDTLVRRGIFAFFVTTLLFIFIFISLIKKFNISSSLYIQLFTVLVLGSFSEVYFDFSVLNYFGVFLIYIFLSISCKNIS